MADRKIDYDSLIEMVARKMTQADIARTLGVNPSTITRAIKRLREHATRSLIVKKGDRYEEVHFKLWDNFMKGFEAVDKLIDALDAYVYKGDRTVFAAMQRKTESKSVEQGSNESKEKRKKGAGNKSRIEQKIEHFDFTVDPKALLAKVLEIREKHVMDALEIVKEIMGVEQLRSFLSDMVQTMLKASPGSRNEIEETLKRHELIRSFISINPVDPPDMRN